MTKFESLKKEAREACNNRGHKMGRFAIKEVSHRNDSCLRGKLRHRAEATCKVCGMYVEVDTHPAPNGIDIGGEAVATHCTGEGSKECKTCCSTYSPSETQAIYPGLPEGYCSERCHKHDTRD